MTDLSMELDTAQEVNDLLHGTSWPGQGEIEAEAEDEMAALEAEMAAAEAVSAPAQARSAAATASSTTAGASGVNLALATALPSAPAHTVASTQPTAHNTVDDELAALEAEMA
jgi:hypothetical protein